MRAYNIALVDSAFHPLKDGKWILWLSDTKYTVEQIAMGECSADGSLQADSKIKFSYWPTSWLPPGTDQLLLKGPRLNFALWLDAVDELLFFFALCINDAEC